MTTANPPPGWYPDPEFIGSQRYFDGITWTDHRFPSQVHPYLAYGGWGRPPWKGAQLGRPPYGPGALAEPGRRLCARLLDALVLLAVFSVFVLISVVLVAPHVGPLFPKTNPNSSAPTPFPGIGWIYLTVLGCAFATGLVWILYETIATTRYGRTLGKAWLHIRPVRADGRTLGWGRSLGRIALYWASGLLSWIGLLDPLWCLWDENRQCLHDKVADTIVINDLFPGNTNARPSGM